MFFLLYCPPDFSWSGRDLCRTVVHISAYVYRPCIHGVLLCIQALYTWSWEAVKIAIAVLRGVMAIVTALPLLSQGWQRSHAYGHHRSSDH